MRIDVKGRVNNTRLPETKPLLPMFEAVVNALQSIEPLGKAGEITVKVERESAQVSADLGDGYKDPIIAFVVQDNGVGFNEANYISFNTSDSTLKSAQGGKGIGRFLWLKAFDKVEIDSVCRDNGRVKRRCFDFCLSDEAVENERVNEVDEKTPLLTSVRLVRFAEKYQSRCPKKLRTLAQRLLEHVIAFLAQDAPPRIWVEESDGSERLSLNQLFEEEYKPTSTVRAVSVGTHTLTLFQARLYAPDEQTHRLHYCAHRREVVSDNLGQYVPNLSGRLHDDRGKSFVWSVFVSGKILDDSVIAERVQFNFPDDEDPLFPEQVTLQKIRSAVLSAVKGELEPFLLPIQQQKTDEIKRFVQNEAPQYRPVLTYKPEILEQLAPNLPPDKLDLELHKAKFELEREIKQQSREALATGNPTDPKYQDFLTMVNDVGKSALAQYVVHRRFVLQLLEKALQQNADGAYSREDVIHGLLFPLRATSDDVQYEQQNLWVIDERLSYHTYLTSDRTLTSNAIIDSTSKERPDLLIFNAPLAFVEGSPPFGSIVIVEFKRPLRNDYHDDENPISQVQDYVRRIREGKTLDKAGRPLQVRPEMPFYAFVVCDLTPNLIRYAENAGFIRTPDSMGFFGYTQTLGSYFEVISYTKLVVDAMKRNRILFEKLNLPTS